MGVSSTQVGDHWGSARTVQPTKHYFPCEDDDLGQAVPCGDHLHTCSSVLFVGLSNCL